jgi:hypothetical protein
MLTEEHYGAVKRDKLMPESHTLVLCGTISMTL